MKLWTDDRRTDGRTTEPAYIISSPGAFGSGELKSGQINYMLKNLIFEVLRLVSVVFGTASAVQTFNTSPPYGHLVPIKEKQLGNPFKMIGLL